ncbi:MAG: protein kinase [bacterium]|nr:protein kinase [bacterium]
MVPDRIGRYRIEGKLGIGGMGEVYRAWDEDLDRRVAIKLIRAGAESTRSRKRFRREARMVAALDHPAIVRIHDILPWKDRDCIVMEYVEGRTLTELVGGRPLDLERALALALEITGGLAAAHARSIVHRDLKADNIMVTSAGHPTPGSAKILDFGLAKQLASESREPTVSVEGTLVGTFHSMSPEQIRGTEVDCRSDLFSLGTLLYQMATGEAPFRGDSANEILAQVLTQSQPPARQLNPEIPQELSQLIERLLEKPPDRRPQSAEEVIAVLAPLAAEASGPAPFVRSPAGPGAARATGAGTADPAESATVVGERSTVPLGRRVGFAGRQALLAVAAVTVAAVVAVWIIRYLTAGPPSVAVLGFENRTGRENEAWLSTAISEILIANLAAGDKARIVTGDQIAPVMKELSLDAGDRLSSQQLQLLRSHLRVDFFLVGFYETGVDPTAQHLRLLLRLRNAAGGAIEAEGDDEGTWKQLFLVVHRAAEPIREAVGIGQIPPDQERTAGSWFPADAEAARRYSEGLEKLRNFELLDARDDLQAAITADPQHPLPYYALSLALFDLEHNREAEQAAQKARERSASLPRSKQLEIEARYYAMAGDWEEAEESYRELNREYPHELSYGLGLADTLIQARKSEQALEIIEGLRHSRLLIPSGGRLDIAAARANIDLHAYEEAKRLARIAGQEAEHSGTPLLAAQARLEEAKALEFSGGYPEAITALDRAMVDYLAVDNWKGAAETLSLASIILSKQGNYRRAMEKIERARRIYRDSGDIYNEAVVGLNMGSNLMDLGRIVEAETTIDESLGMFKLLGAELEAATANAALGTAFQDAGRIPDARRRYEEAAVVFEKLDAKPERASVLTNLGQLFLIEGELARAQSRFEAALEIDQDINDPFGKAYDRIMLGEVLATRGELAGARKYYDMALDKLNKQEDSPNIAEANLRLAALELSEDNFGRARELAKAAETAFQEANLRTLAELAKLLQGRVLLSQPRPDLSRVRKILDGAEFVDNVVEDPRIRFELEIVAARWAAQSGESAETAVGGLDQTAEDAAAAGYLAYVFEARLAAAEIEMDEGDVAGATARLDALIKDAESKGFGLIVRRAAAVRGR